MDGEKGLIMHSPPAPRGEIFRALAHPVAEAREKPETFVIKSGASAGESMKGSDG